MTKPVALIILDGFGHREAADDNAISNASTPTWNKLVSTYPNTTIQTSGMAVGLPEGQMGNSEVGHMNLGAGRVVYQNYTRINKAIEDGDFFQNEALVAAMDSAAATGKAIHLLGLLSPGGVHSHEDHLLALCKMAKDKGVSKLFVHGILDGRDMPPRSAEPSIKKVEAFLADQGVGQLATITGRYFAMDRDNRWDRIQSAYDMYTQNKAEYQANNGVEGLAAAYERDENDEFVKATVITGAEAIQDGDSVICFNFRPDRAREITNALVVGDSFDGFDRQVKPKLAHYVMMTQYAADIPADCAFPPAAMTNDLGEYVSSHGKTQLRIAETEKYAHVTFFFSGGQEETYEGEKRILIKSPDVATYDLKPEMSAPEVTENLVSAIKNKEFDLIVCNFANGDMVGHTGKYDAAVKAVEALDQCLQQVTDAIIEAGGECIITADHGNCEQMIDPNTGGPLTSHTNGPVPFVYVTEKSDVRLRDDGSLCDVAPSLLTMMGLDQPSEMTGKSVIQ